MKRCMLLWVIVFLIGIQITVNAQDLAVSDVQNSGCVRETRADAAPGIPTITLLKEGNILTVNLQNYWSTCDTQDLEVTPTINDGSNGVPCSVFINVVPIHGELAASCICPYNISFTVHGVEADSFYLNCWWFKGRVNLTEGEPLALSNEYYPEGTKWTEIRLDTLNYDSWYSKVGDEWVPNFKTVEYSVKGTYPYYSETFGDNSLKCVYTTSKEWTDSLSLLIHEGIINEYDNYERGVMATVPVYLDYWDVPFPASAYNFDWRVGMAINFIDICLTNGDVIPDKPDFGIIEEIKEGNFGGIKPLKYTDVNGVRIIQGIGVTTWNDGECLFGPVKPYNALSAWGAIEPEERHYRSMLVHFERNGEVLYNVWPGTPDDMVTYTEGQMATIILPTTPDASKGKYYRLDRCEDGKIIFEQEPNPKARVPYIIVPNQDFFIDLSMLDLAGLSQDSVSIKGISFIGSYRSEELESKEGWYVDIIDTTPDCSLSPSWETEKGTFLIGALRAYLSWEDPYSQGPTKGEPVKLEIVLHDNGTSIAEMESDRVRSEKYDDAIYDLSGLRVDNRLQTTDNRPRGIYIQNGKKRAKL